MQVTVQCFVFKKNFFQTFNVPAVANSEAKAFEFQTNKIEKGSIECLHQHRQVRRLWTTILI